MADRIVHPPIEIGATFGWLTISSIYRFKTAIENQERWFCDAICKCGKTARKILVKSLPRSITKSCGCTRNFPDEWHTTARAFTSAKYRCNNPRSANYKGYGARGITFEFDRVHDLIAEIGLKPDGAHLDRIDNNLGYKSGNVRWLSARESTQNTRRSCIWYVDGKKFNSSTEAAHAYGVTYTTIRAWCKGVKSQGVFYPPKPNCWAEKKYK